MKKLYLITLLLAIVGAINWGLVGLFNINLVTMIFGEMSNISRIIYIIIGLSAIFILFNIKCLIKSCCTKVTKQVDHNVAVKQVIDPDSPAKDEQEKFISEGGDSQSLKR
jgi:uncharacterized protein